jgi:hypothetical protein
MKITKRQLKRIIREEKQRLTEDVADVADIAKAAGDLGQLLGGYPNKAKAIAQAMRDQGMTDAADALMKAYQAQQTYLDMIYSAYD